jgi:hypothetical protein
MSFRWFHADDLPEQPTTAVVAAADAPKDIAYGP